MRDPPHLRYSLLAGALFAALMVFTGATPADSAAAQSEPRLQTLNIDVWPEYDRSAVLVMYRVQLEPSVPLPARLSFRIPAAAGTPNAVAERRGDGQLVTIAYERTVDGEWASIELTATVPEVQLEYYDPRLERDGAARSFAFVWPGDYAVQRLEMSIQQPAGATDLRTSPPATSTGTGTDGLFYYDVQLDPMAAGDSATVTVAYTRATETLTADTLPREAPQPATSTPTSRPVASAAPMSLIVAITIGIAAIGVLVAALVARSRSGGPTPSAPGRRAAAAFCTRCGATAQQGDRFCHSCGKPIRGH